MEIKELTNLEFKEFSEKFRPSSMYQTPYYAFTMNEQNCDSFFVGLFDNNILRAASLILVQKINGFKYGFAPRGFLLNYNDFNLLETFTKELKQFLKKKDIVAIKVNPLIIKSVYNNEGKMISKNAEYDKIFAELKTLGYYHLGYNNYFEALKPRFEAVVNIDLPYTGIFANITKAFRTKIRKADNDGIKVYHGNINNLEYLYLQTKGKYPRDLDYFKQLYNFFDKENLIDFYYSKLDTTEYLKITQNLYNEYSKLSNKLNNELLKNPSQGEGIMNQKLAIDNEFEKIRGQLAVATNYLRDYPDGIVLASALVVKWQDEIYLIMDGHNEEYKNFNGKHLLLWKLMGRYSKLGYKRFNLGGVSNIQKDDKKYKGLNEFKLSFNAKVIEYAGDFELITNNALYFMYRRTTNFSNMLKSGKN